MSTDTPHTRTDYTPPTLTRVGSVRELTLTPTGKHGSPHDASAFVDNFVHGS